MKKILFAASLFAGTILGLANNNVKEAKSIDESVVKIENSFTKTPKVYKFNSIEEAKMFLARCTDVHAFFEEVEVSDGNGGTTTEYELVGTMEISYDCENGGVSLYIWL